MLTDPRIDVDKPTAKKIAEVICAEIKASIDGNKHRYVRAKRCENQYGQVTKWMARNKICNKPWEGAADYFVALTEWVIDAVWARVLNTLFSQEPYMTAIGEEASDKPKEEGVTDFVDVILREVVRLYENSNFFFKQMVKLPFAVLKYEWEQEFDTGIFKESAQTFIGPDGQPQYLLPDDPETPVKMAEMIANGYQPGGNQDVWVQQDKELINGMQLRYVRFEDYVYSPNAKRNSPLYWEGDRCWFTLNGMQLKAKQEQFIAESVRMVRLNVKWGDKTGKDRIIALRSEPIECFNWYGRLPFNENNEVDFESEENIIEQEVICVVSYKEEELLQIKHWDKKRMPWPNRVYLRGEFEETEEFEGRSLAEKLYMTQKELNQLHNNIMNNAYLAMMKIFVKRSDLTGLGETPRVFPGAIWEEDNLNEIRMLDVGDVKSIALQLEQTFLNFAERISNISIFQTGTTREKGGQKTLGEVQATIEEGNIGMDKFIQRCHNILRTICKWTVDAYADRMPPGLERRIRGEQDQMIFPTQENMGAYQEKGVNPYWEQDDLAGQFDFKWHGTSLNANKEWKIAVANDLMERYLPQPLVAGSLLATWDILKRGLIARGIDDYENILPPKESIIAEMKMMQAKAQAEEPRGPVKKIQGPVGAERGANVAV